MYANERYDQILAILKVKKKVTVEKLVKELYVSPATVRRDLDAMQKRGLLKRTHGGAILFYSSNEESSLFVREEIMKKEKHEICEKCTDLIKSNQSIFIDSSSTVSHLIPLLNQFKTLTLVTNGLSSALLLKSNTNFRVFIPSGFIQSQSNSVLGSSTINQLASIHVDLCIISCAGFDLEHGISEASIEQAEVKRLMIKNANKAILLIDSSKFKKVFISKICDLTDIDTIITDKGIPEDYVTAIQKLGIHLIY